MLPIVSCYQFNSQAIKEINYLGTIRKAYDTLFTPEYFMKYSLLYSYVLKQQIPSWNTFTSYSYILKQQILSWNTFTLAIDLIVHVYFQQKNVYIKTMSSARST